jgi:hypothetical protein
MQLYTYLGAALMALLVMLLPALAHKQHWNVIREDWRHPLRIVFGVLHEELGVAVVTYISKFGNTGTTTPPTAAEANFLVTQVAQVFLADTDTEAIMVHNWGGALGPSFASFGFPIVIMNKILGAGAAPNGPSVATNFTFGLGNSNQVYIEKAVGAAGGTFLVYLMLPHSLISRSH